LNLTPYKHSTCGLGARQGLEGREHVARVIREITAGVLLSSFFFLLPSVLPDRGILSFYSHVEAVVCKAG